MSKCSICSNRKGKRTCMQTGAMVCTQCCGQTRNKDACEGCRYFRAPQDLRRYDKIPRFAVEEMDTFSDLPTYSNTVEGTLCLWDYNHEGLLNDELAIKVIDLLLDKYHFGDTEISTPSVLLKEGFDMVVASIEEDMPDIPNETIVKILGVVRFVAKRRTTGRREYFDIIHRYVGLRAGPGTRVQGYWESM